jgi:hypothetical protein
MGKQITASTPTSGLIGNPTPTPLGIGAMDATITRNGAGDLQAGNNGTATAIWRCGRAIVNGTPPTDYGSGLIEARGGSTIYNLLFLTSQNISVGFQCTVGAGWVGTFTPNGFSFFTNNNNGEVFMFPNHTGVYLGTNNATAPGGGGTPTNGWNNLGTAGYMRFNSSPAAAYDASVGRQGVGGVQIGDGGQNANGKIFAARANLNNVPVFANNAAAIAGGLGVGDFYRTGADPDPVCIVH